MTTLKGKKTINNQDGGAICGGVVSFSTFKSDPDAYMMAFVLPDKWFRKYELCLLNNYQKKAQEIFEKYARSVI